ncbi:MAG: hypothetical protein P5700_13845 [Arthrospira platensis PCC 7345]|nr:hypothetical protein [Arthrospira platensis PCC 7345]
MNFIPKSSDPSCEGWLKMLDRAFRQPNLQANLASNTIAASVTTPDPFL